MTNILLLCAFLTMANAAEPQVPWIWASNPDAEGMTTICVRLESRQHETSIDHAPLELWVDKDRIPLLHGVYVSSEDGRTWNFLARMSNTLGDTAVSVRGNWKWDLQSAGKIVVLSDSDSAALTQRWRQAYVAFLKERIDTHEDHEMELLLLLGFTGEFTTPRQTWKRDDLSRFLCGLAGLNDISDALPPKELRQSQREQGPRTMPAPIALPPVDVKNAPAASGSKIAHLIPRSCYFIEWDNFDTAISVLQTFTQALDEWSPGTWPQSAGNILNHQMARLGLDEAYVKTLREAKVDAIGFAGWDPYFATGTNLLLIIHAEKPIAPPAQAPFAQAIDPQTVLIASCEKLRDHALRAAAEKKSLEDDAGFRSERSASLGKDGETDLGFCYLSDPWLTNFISPRWIIHGMRRRAIDARIRLTTAYQVLHAAEHHLTTLPDLKTLQEASFLSGVDRNWLFEDLLIKDGIVVHQSLGGLYAHPPIDTLTFDSVSAAEAKGYEDFRNLYQRRWQRMDPIALRLLRQKDGKIRSRLHISPISNRSDFAGLAPFLPQVKLPHRLITSRNCAAGLSVTLRTESAVPMLGLRLPSLVTVQATSLDFAWTSHLPSTWLSESRGEDYISHLRIPGAILVPNLLIEGVFGSGLLGVRNWEPSGEADIQRTEAVGKAYPVLRWTSEKDGISALTAQPALLREFRDLGVQTRETMPCDLHVWIDGEKGYLLRRRLWQLAVMNRSLADWRRTNRLTRIRDYCGLSDQDERLKPLAACFSKPGMSMSVGSYMLARKEDGDQGGRWGSVATNLDNLPAFIRDLTHIDMGISVGLDDVLFDGIWTWDSPAPELDAEAAPAQVLDFDH